MPLEFVEDELTGDITVFRPIDVDDDANLTLGSPGTNVRFLLDGKPPEAPETDLRVTHVDHERGVITVEPVGPRKIPPFTATLYARVDP